MSVKLYPVGIQNFEKIRREGYFYVLFPQLSTSVRRNFQLYTYRRLYCLKYTINFGSQ